MSKALKQYKTRRKEFYNAHPKQAIVREYVVSIIMMGVSALLAAITFRLFQAPTVLNASGQNIALPLISGGIAGISRSIDVIFQMCGINNTFLIYSIFYAVLNIPIFYLSFRYIGFRFGLFTTINVLVTSLITNFMNLDFLDQLAKNIACVIEPSNLQAGLFARTFLAGIFSGLCSVVAFNFGGSSGGGDSVSYFFSMRKSTNIGRYNVIINAFVFALFGILNCALDVKKGVAVGDAVSNLFLILLFVSIFSFVSAVVVDTINRFNRKDQIQIVTKQEGLTKLLLANIPHGATIIRAKGAFTGEDRIIIYIIVSTYETKNIINLIREADPDSFINVTNCKQVIGKFNRHHKK